MRQNKSTQLLLTCLLSLACIFTADAKKKLVIHKCIKSNGTIAFQEDPCKKKFAKKKVYKKHFAANKFYRQSYKSPDQKPYKRQTKANIKPLTKLANINFKDNSTQTIANSAKGYTFSIKALKRWQTTNKVYNNKLVHMQFIDYVPQAEMSLMIDFIFPDNKNFSTQELQELVALVGSRYLKGSKEGRVIPYELNVQNGKGVMATFTHSNMTPNYKFASRGAIFKGKWLVQFTLLSNSQQSAAYLFALQALTKSLKIY